MIRVSVRWDNEGVIDDWSSIEQPQSVLSSTENRNGSQRLAFRNRQDNLQWLKTESACILPEKSVWFGFSSAEVVCVPAGWFCVAAGCWWWALADAVDLDPSSRIPLIPWRQQGARRKSNQWVKQTYSAATIKVLKVCNQLCVYTCRNLEWRSYIRFKGRF